MFSVGDKVVHPGHGPGIITAIERRQVVQEAKKYYVIDMLAGGGTLMTPVKQAKNVGLRLAVSGSSVRRLLNKLVQEPHTLPDDFRERQTEVEERLKQGDVFTMAQVVRDLAWHDEVRGLTKRDTQLMQRAEETLAAELSLAKDIEVKEALEQVQSIVAEAVDARVASQAVS